MKIDFLGSVDVTAKVKNLFFDRPGVMAKMDRTKRRVLSRFGAFVRKSAIWSIRTRKKPSPPGKPPSSHTGLLKRFIFFAYEPATDGVVIGPERLNQKTGDAPPALEYGGQSRVTSGGRRRRKVLRTVTIRPRPFMKPALDENLPKLPGMWRDSVK